MESLPFLETVSVATLKTPEFESVSVSVRFSVSPVRKFVIVTVAVSLMSPFRFSSESVMIGLTESPILTAIGKTPEDGVVSQ